MAAPSMTDAAKGLQTLGDMVVLHALEDPFPFW